MRISRSPCSRLAWAPIAPLVSARCRGVPHCNIRVGPWVFDGSLRDGFLVCLADAYPIEPIWIEEVVLTQLWVTPEQWISTRPSWLATVLDALWFPVPRKWVHSCVTEAARMIGVTRRCRVPSDLMAAIKDGDLNHGIPVGTEDQGDSTA